MNVECYVLTLLGGAEVAYAIPHDLISIEQVKPPRKQGSVLC